MAPAPITLALVIVLGAADAPAGPPPSDVLEQVRALLGAIHGPVPPETIRALGPGAEEALVEVARADGPPLRRVRALEALAGLGGPRAEAVHRDVARRASAPRAVRRAAIRGLGRLAGTRARLELSGFLERDHDPTVRAAAAEALAAYAPDQACAGIRAQARSERSENGTARYSRALKICDEVARPAK